ncbi:hypothetical protein [Treponema putidum]|uniref:hypothetical protein n=1 Tax=Treponema putidum TaxID=221027 RepID=UPI002105B062|nr:hypothetical protein [Treponema putidum]
MSTDICLEPLCFAKNMDNWQHQRSIYHTVVVIDKYFYSNSSFENLIPVKYPNGAGTCM